VYFWRGRGHRKVRIKLPLGSPEFQAEYTRLKNEAQAAPPTSTGPTYKWLCQQYMTKGTSFFSLDPATQAVYRRVLQSTWDERVNPDVSDVYADFPLDRITTQALEVLRDRKADQPGAADNRVKAIRALFKWAKAKGHLPANPARDLAKPRLPNAGHHTWDVAEVEQFEARWPVGTKQRLTLALLVYVGVRRSDVVRLGRQHRRMVVNESTGLREPWFKFTQYKNRNRTPVETNVPILPELDRIIEASPTGDLTYLVTSFGKPYTANGFGNWFRDACRQAGLRDCSAHGLRKASATLAAEQGATVHQLMAIFGWLSMREAERYTKAAERRRMAGSGMHLLARRDG
ncbi:MAG: tyrosine-type recombinase/integrase, partial [Hyphomicrobiaceae bacterium]